MPHMTAVPDNWERDYTTDEDDGLPECETCGKTLNAAWNYCPQCGRRQKIDIPTYF